MSIAARRLRAMGITTWVLRSRPEPARHPGEVPVNPQGAPWVLQAATNPVATVVVQWPDRNLDLTGTHEAAVLLTRILGALERPLDRFAIIGWEFGQPAPAAEHQPVFCLSDEPPDGSAGWVMLPSLSRMLSEGRAAKAPAWSTLKAWLGRLGR